MPQEELLTPKETAEILRVSIGTLANWRVNQRLWLPFVKLERSVRYRRSDIQAFLEGLGPVSNRVKHAWAPPFEGDVNGAPGAR